MKHPTPLVKPIQIDYLGGAVYAIACFIGGFVFGVMYERYLTPRGVVLTAWQFAVILFGALTLALLFDVGAVWFFADRIKGDLIWVLVGITPSAIGAMYGYELAMKGRL